MSTTRKQTAKQAAFLFFLRHAGFSYDPKTETARQGKARCARELAKAERDARSEGFTFEWEHDSEGCSGCDCGSEECDCSTGNEHETLGCILLDEKGAVLGSLWGICKPSAEYRRVIEAELASEALARGEESHGLYVILTEANHPWKTDRRQAMEENSRTMQSLLKTLRTTPEHLAAFGW